MSKYFDHAFAQLLLATEECNFKGGGRNKGGLSRKSRVSDVSGVAFAARLARMMVENNGSFYWDITHPVEGLSSNKVMRDEEGLIVKKDGVSVRKYKGSFNNISEYMVAEMLAPDGSIHERVAAAREHKGYAASAKTQLHEFLRERKAALYSVAHEDVNRDVLLTIDPDYVVNSVGDTALDTFTRRSLRGLEGKMYAHRRDAEATMSKEEVAGAMAGVLARTMARALPTSEHVAQPALTVVRDDEDNSDN